MMAMALLVVPFTAVTGHAASGRWLVEARPSANAYLTLTGAEPFAPSVGIWRVSAKTASGLRRAGLAGLAHPEVQLGRVQDTPTDPFYSREWWLTTIGVAQPPAGPGVPVTVIDTGVDFSHPEFAGRPDTAGLNPQNVTDSQDDYHGTAVASVIGAPANGVGLVGVYPQAAIRTYDADLAGRFTNGELIRAIETALDSGRSVINISLGSTVFDPFLQDEVFSAVRRGSLVVAASGNEAEEGNPLNFPANLAHVLTVAATDINDRPATFSSSSPGVDLAAPGVDIIAAVPTLFDPSGYSQVSGTSFSTPIVSAVAAWVWTVRPTLDNTQLFDLLRFTARDVWTPGFDAETGFGVVNVPAALGSEVLPPDPQEPNDDVRLVRPGALFPTGSPALTSRVRAKATIRARIDVTEDPVDVYRVWIPAARTLNVTLTGAEPVVLRVWKPATASLAQSSATARKNAAASSTKSVKRHTLRVANATKTGAYYFVDVRPGAKVGNTSYTLALTTSAAAKR
jgi:hypothetical protein